MTKKGLSLVALMVVLGLLAASCSDPVAATYHFTPIKLGALAQSVNASGGTFSDNGNTEGGINCISMDASKTTGPVYADFKAVNFKQQDGPTVLTARFAAWDRGKVINVRLDDPVNGTLVGTITTAGAAGSAGAWTVYETGTSMVGPVITGTHDVYFSVPQGTTVNLLWIQFK